MIKDNQYNLDQVKCKVLIQICIIKVVKQRVFSPIIYTISLYFYFSSFYCKDFHLPQICQPAIQINLFFFPHNYYTSSPRPRMDLFALTIDNFYEHLSIPSQQTHISSQNSHQPDEFDLVNTYDLQTIFRSKLVKQAYPQNFVYTNVFCPSCTRLISPKEEFSSYYFEVFSRKFFLHDKCILPKLIEHIFNIPNQIQEMQQFTGVKEKDFLLPFGVGDREFLMEASIEHPIGGFKYVPVTRKIKASPGQLKLKFKEESSKDKFEFGINTICFPFSDFTFVVSIEEINSGTSKKSYKMYVNLSKVKLQKEKKKITLKYEDFYLYLNVYYEAAEKQKVVEQMNLKYKYPIDFNGPLFELDYIQVAIPDEKYEDDQIENNIEIHENISLLLDEHKYSTKSTSSTRIQHYHYPVEHPNNIQSSLGQFSPVSQKTYEKIDLLKLIQSNELSGYVKANVQQSRNVQKILDDQIHPSLQKKILDNILPQLSDLVVHQYANYVIQKLFLKSTYGEKLIILKTLKQKIPSLVQIKQGTHTLQYFLEHIDHNAEMTQIIVESIWPQFNGVCFNPEGTHFIQKMIRTLPIESTKQFFLHVSYNIVLFGTQKNGMCVLKHMLLKLKQLNSQLATELKKSFINSITLNTDKLIDDAFGNYVIQFSYESFGQKKLSGIGERILVKFGEFSMCKHSSNVVLKCITTYWADRGYTDRIFNLLSHDKIIDMYKSKDGNKILLQLIQRNPMTYLRQKILSIVNSLPTKPSQNQDRWGMLQIRSGPITGDDFKSFSQTVRQLESINSYKQKEQRKGKKK